MLFVVFAAYLALLASTVHAFFDWHPALDDKRNSDDASTLSDNTNYSFKRQVARLSAKFAHMHKARENQFQVVTPVTPSRNEAAGIFQDGTDFSYFAEVKLGSRAVSRYMLLDTGAGTSWLMGSTCTTSACKKHNLYGPADSTTLRQAQAAEEEEEDGSFSITYGSGAVTGNLATDRLSFAGLQVNDFQFGVAHDVSDHFNAFPFDGILGLSRNGGDTPGFLATVAAAASDNQLDANLFAVSLSRAADDEPNTAEISLGSANRDKYTGDITYTPLVDRDGDWSVSMDGLSYDGKQVVGRTLAYIDTGTTYVFGPPDLVATMHNAVPGASTSDNVTWTVPCDTTAASSPSLTFSGKTWSISKEDWLSVPNGQAGSSSDSSSSLSCTSNIYGIEVLPDTLLIGATFLKNVYTVFDSDNARIGFAAKASHNSDDASNNSSDNSADDDQANDSTTADSPSNSTDVAPEQETGDNDGSGSDDQDPDSESAAVDSRHARKHIVYASTLFCLASAISVLS